MQQTLSLTGTPETGSCLRSLLSLEFIRSCCGHQDELPSLTAPLAMLG